MTSKATSYDLKELCDEAGVTARTVRYYIQQGLLRSPSSTGRGAKYTVEHLKLLFLIRRLQENHLPLSEIRRTLNTLPERDIERLIQKQSRRKKTTAIEYMKGVLQDSPSKRPQPGSARGKTRGAVGGRNGGTRVHTQWERIELDPDIELHVRRPLSRGQRKKLDQLLSAASDLFESK